MTLSLLTETKPLGDETGTSGVERGDIVLYTLPAPAAVEVGGAETPAAYCGLLKSAS